ncbi:MAG: hypothetical protein C5B54_10030 [Acidobacteria bacterium]|nr:MAG: hypothetical protein C5B54_10030 [Acidobacteriota bacterium]
MSSNSTLTETKLKSSAIELRDVYANKAFSQIPRLLGNQDRNSFSPTYGCFHRDFWLDKTSDFPDAVRQFGTHALALVYKHDFPGNIYKNHPKIRDWTIAAMDYWTTLQHAEGSFDEFYPYERGWVGPSAFTTFAISEAFRLLQEEVPADAAKRILNAIHNAALFIISGEKEEDHLANHHAMACLAVWKAYELLKDEKLKSGFEKLFAGFLNYQNANEGWSREYDGVDPGYLSATVSFFAKIYKTNRDPRILEILKKSVEFSSYFVYPNGFYAGSMGSRNTLHFYSDGYEILAEEIPLAASIAQKMLQGLSEGKLVAPEIMSDRYVFYRVPEFLESYLDYKPRRELISLPYERSPLQRYFPESRIFVSTRPNHYIVANLAKGGVIKAFETPDGKILLNDCGIIGRLSTSEVITSQWVDPDYKCMATDDGFEVGGQMNIVPSNKLFTPLKHLIFRAALIALGWNPSLAHWLKGQIRKSLTLGRRPVPIHFQRKLQLQTEHAVLTTEIWRQGNAEVTELSIGDEFFVRFVPQSRYFQSQELNASRTIIPGTEIRKLNSGERIRIEATISLQS